MISYVLSCPQFVFFLHTQLMVLFCLKVGFFSFFILDKFAPMSIPLFLILKPFLLGGSKTI